MVKIKLNNNEYPILDSALAVPTADFVAHLETIAGNGIRVVVDGVEYNVDPSKVASAVAEMETVLGNLPSGEEEAPVAGLYRSGTNYTELITSWDELTRSNAIRINEGVLTSGGILPPNMPEKNEYGFYYGVLYSNTMTLGSGYVFYEDGSIDSYYDNKLFDSLPARSAEYHEGYINASRSLAAVFSVIDDGFALESDWPYTLGERPKFEGDLLIPCDNGITAIGSYAFNENQLTSVVIPESVELIDEGAFMYGSNLTTIKFTGTMAQWNEIEKDMDWNFEVPATHVQCSDGQVEL
jgi:hypothetical protein